MDRIRETYILGLSKAPARTRTRTRAHTHKDPTGKIYSIPFQREREREREAGTYITHPGFFSRRVRKKNGRAGSTDGLGLGKARKTAAPVVDAAEYICGEYVTQQSKSSAIWP